MPAYLGAVGTASGCFTLYFSLPTLFFVWNRVSMAILWSDFIMIPIVFAATAILASVLAFPFAFLSALAADKLNTNDWRYWGVAGTFSGLACIMIVAFILWSTFPSVADDGSEVTFLTTLRGLVPPGALAGCVGGLSFRWVGRRQAEG